MVGCKALCSLSSELCIGITVRVKRHFGSHDKKLVQNGSRKKEAIIQTESFNFKRKILYKFAKTEKEIVQVWYYH